jgi:argininosuccinate lyase
LVLVKGLPLAYNRDMQEDKPAAFDAAETIGGCLEVAIPLVAGAKLNREVIAGRLEDGFLDATTLMEQLIKIGLPQRTAHHLVGDLVRLAREKGVGLAGLDLEEFRKLAPQIDRSVYDGLGTNRAVEAFCSYGSTGREQVEAQVRRWRERLGV